MLTCVCLCVCVCVCVCARVWKPPKAASVLASVAIPSSLSHTLQASNFRGEMSLAPSPSMALMWLSALVELLVSATALFPPLAERGWRWWKSEKCNQIGEDVAFWGVRVLMSGFNLALIPCSSFSCHGPADGREYHSLQRNFPNKVLIWSVNTAKPQTERATFITFTIPVL